VVTVAGDKWRWGGTRENHEKLQPILHALQKLQAEGLTAAGVVAAIHRRRVLPLAERRLRLSEMKLGVAGTVGRLDAGALSQPPMRPDHGYVSLVSARSSFCFAPCFFTFLVLTLGIFVHP
jgi:hypothetical protein